MLCSFANVRILFFHVLLVLFVCANNAFCGYFLDEEKPKNTLKSNNVQLIFGGNLQVAFYQNSFDFGGDIGAEYRVMKNHSLSIMAAYLLDGKLFGVSLDWRLFFSGQLMDSGHEDFLRAGFTGFIFEKLDENYFSPAIEFGYGRSFLPFKNANFLLRLEICAAYVLGEALPNRSGDIFANESARFMSFMSFGVYFF